MARRITINGKPIAGCSPRLAAAVQAASPEKPKRKRMRTGLPRPAPRPLDDIAMPAGRRIVCYWPPVGLAPNDRLNPYAKNRLAQQYKRECWAEAIGAKLVVPAERPIRIQIDFFPPTRAARDDDNAIAAFKSGRDGIALALKIDDADFRIVPVWHEEPRSCVVVTILEPETTA
ncbi:MAG TPA: hypothetical protein VF503_09005 [Sphingobium sp.]|uniref:hypothetical protein n=1 Tax=Sphingobium sp. TaxID=1912891 RepID=UPI002ECFC104